MTEIAAICFGEVLFDLFPSGAKPGGAPMNVAIHLQNLGIPTAMISGVGKDEYGQQLVKFLKEKNVSTDLIQTIAGKDTGTVRVNVDVHDNPTYTILEGVAWDFINDSFLKQDLNPRYIVHGSLICRSVDSQNSLEKLLNGTKAKIVFDLNVRSPFYSKTLIDSLLSKAHIVKMNEEEFEMLKRWYYIKNAREQADLKALKYLFENIEVMIVTKGGKGAVAWSDGNFVSTKALPIKVMDTVGSGDAFLGAFLSKHDAGASLEDCLKFASATGAYVATQAGANPAYKEKDILELMDANQ